MLATNNGDHNIVNLLILNNADVNLKIGDGNTALLSLSGKHADIAATLLDHGANPDITTKGGDSPLKSAAWEENLDLIEVLLGHGADINIRVDGRSTPLIAAAWTGNNTIVKFLLSKGADIGIKTRKNVTALLEAAQSREDTA